jgi:hypothetical protein
MVRCLFHFGAVYFAGAEDRGWRGAKMAIPTAAKTKEWKPRPDDDYACLLIAT